MKLVDVVTNKQEHAVETELRREESCGDSEHIDAIVATGVGTDVPFVACRFFNMGSWVTIDVTILSGTV